MAKCGRCGYPGVGDVALTGCPKCGSYDRKKETTTSKASEGGCLSTV